MRNRESSHRRRRDRVWRAGLEAGLAAAVVSGVPSTVHALLSSGKPLDATLAAGSLMLPRERRTLRLLLAATVVHACVSVAWAVVLARLLPHQRTVVAGAIAGLGIAALDLGVVGRHNESIRALPLGPQLADHVAFGATVGAVLKRAHREADKEAT